ncbi:MAG: LysR family transcriptional regulator [Alphaproteobacteria bacterium]|nr:LysR family transcriptional regulator [Alphaproteobacteria bacterium]
MKLDRIKHFVVMAEELHFGRAARRLNLSQPSLTLQIQNLEAEVGLTLIRRSKRRAELTPAGRQFLVEARLALHHAEQAAARARLAAAGDTGHLSIGFSVDYAHGFLPGLLASFHRQFPNVKIESRLDVSANLSPAVAERTLDLAFLSPPLLAHPTALREQRLPATRIVAFLPPRHRFARRRKIRLADLKADPFVLTPVTGWTGFYQQVARLFDEAGFVPDVKHEVLDAAMVENLVAEGVGVSMVSVGSMPAKPQRVAVVDLDSRLARMNQAVVWHEQNDSPVLRNFLAAVRAHVGEGTVSRAADR